MAYPAKYDDLIDSETWAFIERSDSFYPPDRATKTINEQRATYDALFRAFARGYPADVTSKDRAIEGPGGGIPIRNYRLDGAEGPAHVIYYHGGGFVVGGLDSHDDVCAEICAATGCAVTSIDYRLSPEHKHPAHFLDAMAGFEHVAGRADAPIILAGDSAGGNLAAAVSHVARRGSRQPSGQVLIYPALGGDINAGSYLEHAQAPMLTRDDIAYYYEIRGASDGDATAAPLHDSDFSDLPPTVAIAAQCDPLADDCDDYVAALQAAGVKAVAINEKGLVHGYLRARHSVERARRSFAGITGAIIALATDRWPY